MFTVLIAEKEHIDAIQKENKLFFEPFLENKELAFCSWNPEGQSLYDSVPGLLDAVGRTKVWRAVIINNHHNDFVKKRNPFDVVDASGVSGIREPERVLQEGQTLEAWEEKWNVYYDDLSKEKEKLCRQALEHPLQKLCTWLCFRPEDYILNEVQEKQDIYDWAMERLGRDNLKASTRLELMEKNHYKRELRMKEHIRRDFTKDSQLNIAYPAEIHCISIRTTENGFFDPDAYWTVRRENEYSTFADRNMYFDKMRFMVIDLLSQAHRNFRNDYIRFLATVLIFASNPVPGSAMQARRLYQLEVDTDDTPLCILVTSYDKKLAATADVIENEMEKIRSEIPGALTDKTAEALFCSPKDVPVVLDNTCNPEKVLTENDYGFFFDYPENEYHKWNRDYQTSKKELGYIVRQQARSVRRSVGQMHMLSEAADVNISRLTPFQMDDIREYTDAAEDEMVASIPLDLADLSAHMERITEASENVKKVISQRMTQKTTLTLSMICLGLFLICFLPFLLSNHGTAMTVMTAILLSASMVCLLAIVILVTVICLRYSVKNAVKHYNISASAVMQEIQDSLKRVSRYLSAAGNVRRGYSVQNYAKKNLDECTKSLRIRKRHLEDIRKRRAYLAEDYQDYIGDRTYWDSTMIKPYEYDFDQTTEYTYPVPFIAGDHRQIDFVSIGNHITVPSSYVTRILVRIEDIYDK